MNKLDKLVNERLQEDIREQIETNTEYAHKFRTVGGFNNDKETYALGDECMKKAQDAVGRLLDLQMNPIRTKPLGIEDEDEILNKILDE